MFLFYEKYLCFCLFIYVDCLLFFFLMIVKNILSRLPSNQRAIFTGQFTGHVTQYAASAKKVFPRHSTAARLKNNQNIFVSLRI